MDLRQIGTLYMHEVRSALREKSIVATSIIVPVVMYPAMLWAVMAGFSFIQGQADRITSEVAVIGLPSAHAPLLDSLQARDRMEVRIWEGSEEELRREVARGRLDAALLLEPAQGEGAAFAQNFQASVIYSQARDRSAAARSRVEDVVDSYRTRLLADVRSDLGIARLAWADFAVNRSDVATPDESTRFLLALLVPFLTLITVALAAFYPAIDATAGERERSTWETLMTTAVPRGNIAAAKYLYVATFGALGGLLNLGALALSLRWILTPVAGDDVEGLVAGGIPLEAIPIIAIGTAFLGLFVAAGMLVFAIFARNFKEGQSMITPFYLVVILPAVFVQSPDIEFTPALAALPVVNVALLIRDALMGSVALLTGVVTLLSMAVSVALAVSFAQWVMSREEVLLGSSQGGLWRFIKRNLTSSRSRA
jgi:sodium transport system permease protein